MSINTWQAINTWLLSSNAILINKITNNQKTSQPQIIKNSFLNVLNVSQSQSVNVVTISAVGVVDINNLKNKQSLDQVILSQANVLFLNGLSTSQNIEKSNLNVSGVMSIDSMLQQQSLDVVTLTEIGGDLLTVANIKNNQTLTGVQLLQKNTIAVNNLTQGQLLDSVNFGGIVIGYLEGKLTIIYALDGNSSVIN